MRLKASWCNFPSKFRYNIRLTGVRACVCVCRVDEFYFHRARKEVYNFAIDVHDLDARTPSRRKKMYCGERRIWANVFNHSRARERERSRSNRKLVFGHVFHRVRLCTRAVLRRALRKVNRPHLHNIPLDTSEMRIRNSFFAPLTYLVTSSEMYDLHTKVYVYILLYPKGDDVLGRREPVLFIVGLLAVARSEKRYGTACPCFDWKYYAAYKGWPSTLIVWNIVCLQPLSVSLRCLLFLSSTLPISGRTIM